MEKADLEKLYYKRNARKRKKIDNRKGLNMKSIVMYLFLCLAICFNCNKALTEEAVAESRKPIVRKSIFPTVETELKFMDRYLQSLDEAKWPNTLLYAASFADKHNLETFIYISEDFDIKKGASENWRLLCRDKKSWDHFEAGDIMVMDTYYNEPYNTMSFIIGHDQLYTHAFHAVHIDLTEMKCIDDYQDESD